MSTWTFKACAGALTLGAFAGCDLVAPDGPALRSVTLDQGALTLVAPDGYCIDGGSVRRSFALMARCDALAGDPALGPPAVITVTSVTRPGADILDAADLGRAEEDVLRSRDADGVALVEVQGEPPDPSFRNVYWRGATRVGDRVVGVTVYTPREGEPLGNEAPRLLQETLTRTRAQSAQHSDNSATPVANPG